MNTNILQLPIEKTLNEKDVIANKNILNKSKDLTFIRFVLFFSGFFQTKHPFIFICISMHVNFQSHIYNIRGKVCSISRKRLLKEINEISVSKFNFISTLSLHLQYIYSIVNFFIHCSSPIVLVSVLVKDQTCIQ